jgi:hypothetical protein
MNSYVEVDKNVIKRTDNFESSLNLPISPTLNVLSINKIMENLEKISFPLINFSEINMNSQIEEILNENDKNNENKISDDASDISSDEEESDENNDDFKKNENYENNSKYYSVKSDNQDVDDGVENEKKFYEKGFSKVDSLLKTVTGGRKRGAKEEPELKKLRKQEVKKHTQEKRKTKIPKYVKASASKKKKN